MTIWQNEISLTILSERNRNTMGDYLGIEFIEIGDDFLTARMPINQKNKQPIGIMHGGASCVFAETVASNAANFAIDFKKFYCVGLDINTNHIRSVRDGYVSAITRPQHLGKSTQVWGINITNQQDQLVSISRLTLMVLKR